MTLKDLSHMFHQSMTHAFSVKKYMYLLITLIFSGLIYLFFQGLGAYTIFWLKLPLTYISLFLIIGLLMGAGVFFTRIYAQEREGGLPEDAQFLRSTWNLLLKAFCCVLPLLLLFLLFWILLGIFMLLKAIPYLGTLLGVILAFVPFLLNLGTLILFLSAFLALFFVIPSLSALERFDRVEILQQIRKNLFLNLFLLIVAYVPVWIVWKFASSAAAMTMQLYTVGDSSIELGLRSLFIMLPFVAIMTPVVLFFFHFAYESYAIFKR